MAGSCLLNNELHDNGLMTDLGLPPSSSPPHHVPLVSVPMLSPTPLRCSPPLTAACAYPPPTCASKTSEIFPKISNVFQKKSNVFQKISHVFGKSSDVSEIRCNLSVRISHSSSPSTSPITAPCFLLPHASVGTFHSPQRGLLSLQPSSLTSLHNPHFYQGFLTRARAYIGIYIFSLSQPSQTSLITYYKSGISTKVSDNF